MSTLVLIILLHISNAWWLYNYALKIHAIISFKLATFEYTLAICRFVFPNTEPNLYLIIPFMYTFCITSILTQLTETILFLRYYNVVFVTQQILAACPYGRVIKK